MTANVDYRYDEEHIRDMCKNKIKRVPEELVALLLERDKKYYDDLQKVKLLLRGEDKADDLIQQHADTLMEALATDMAVLCSRFGRAWSGDLEF